MFRTGTTRRSRFSCYNPQPPYDQDWSGWGPRLSVDYAVTSHTVLHAGGAITSIVPNLWQDNFITGALPLATSLFANALPGVPLPFQNSVVPVNLPPPFTTAGKPLFPDGDASHVPRTRKWTCSAIRTI